jgi:hypothetical protein
MPALGRHKPAAIPAMPGLHRGHRDASSTVDSQSTFTVGKVASFSALRWLKNGPGSGNARCSFQIPHSIFIEPTVRFNLPTEPASARSQVVKRANLI